MINDKWYVGPKPKLNSLKMQQPKLSKTGQPSVQHSKIASINTGPKHRVQEYYPSQHNK